MATSALARQRADPGDLLQLAAELAAAMPSLDLRFELVDLPVQLLEVLEQPLRSADGTSRASSLPRLRAARARAWRMCAMPCGITSPNSPSKPRIWLACAVRAFTNPWRTRCSASTACCSTLLIGTKRMFGPRHRFADRLGIGDVVLVASSRRA